MFFSNDAFYNARAYIIIVKLYQSHRKPVAIVEVRKILHADLLSLHMATSTVIFFVTKEILTRI